MMSGACTLSPSDFTVERFIGRGCYSIVYEVKKQTGCDSGSSYALKRFFLENDSSVKCVLRERRILERLALAEYQSPFLPMLYYGLWWNCASAFILREGSGCDLYDLLCHVGCLDEANARFYIAEIICGLEHLHSLDIVHLDVKPENILFYPDGHVFVSDLDRSFDMTRRIVPTLDDFTGTPLFMAPEIARGEVIDLRADIWSLGVLTAEMITGPIRPDAKNTEEEFRRARLGTYSIRGLKRLSKPLQSFFSACLQKQLNQRPYLKGVKELRFLKNIDWKKAGSRLLRPPYSVENLHHRSSKENRTPIPSTDIRILSGAFSPTKPIEFDSSRTHAPRTKVVEHEPTPLGDSIQLPATLIHEGYNAEKLNNLFSGFNFIHPYLRQTVDPKVEEVVTDLDKLSLLHDIKTKTHDIFGENNKLEEAKKCSSPSLFQRSRSRGISIGD